MSAIKKKDKDTTRGKTINSGGLRCAPYQLVFSKVIKQTQLYVMSLSDAFRTRKK